MPSLDARPFEWYIREAYGTGLGTRALFKMHPNQGPPMVRSGRVNRFLVYSGAFNPPHRGHLNLVHTAMYESGDEWNFVATIVHPKSDKYIQEKKGWGIQLSHKERVELWKDGPSSVYWVYDRQHGCWDLVDTMTALMEKDGFMTEWACLLGPDYISVKSTLAYKPHGFNLQVTSNEYRKADFIQWASGRPNLQRVLGYGDWLPLRITMKDVYRVLGMLQESQETPREGHESTNNKDLKYRDASNSSSTTNYICHNVKDPERRILFIPRQTNPIKISATRIRKLMIKHAKNREALALHLAPLVLNVGKLLDLFDARRIASNNLSGMELITVKEYPK